MASISKLIPQWVDIIEKGLEANKAEAYRTLRHIFRSLWIYFAILNENFDINIKKEYLNSFKRNLQKIFQFDADFFPLILLYHDIGRPFNREWHTLESAKILQEYNLLKQTQLSIIQKKILYGIIKYHLLPGTIFTGESSYYGASALFNDDVLYPLWQNDNDIDIFFQSIIAFTIIDIWGYDYSKIYDHYFPFYAQMCEKLSGSFSKIKFKDTQEGIKLLYQDLSNIDKGNLKWRVACALRSFQFINTTPLLTKEFYFEKIDEALHSIGLTWDYFETSLGDNHVSMQFQYALPIMMVLAAGEFKRTRFSNNDMIRPDLFKFWQSCSQIITSYDNDPTFLTKTPPLIWNFTFELPQGWFIEPNYLNLIKSETFFEMIRKTSPKFNSEMKCNQLNIKISL
jgi:hypothetical protein